VAATEWSGGEVLTLGGLSEAATAINDAGQIVGETVSAGAFEWSGGSFINLEGLTGSIEAIASGINDAGQVVGYSGFFPPPPAVPESSTWAMMLVGFAGLGLARYRLRST
jgi:probable HAF family extracellular repeat protein